MNKLEWEDKIFCDRVGIIMMPINRIELIRNIVQEIVSESNGDLEFAEKIAQRNDLSLIEKIYAGCIVRNYL